MVVLCLEPEIENILPGSSIFRAVELTGGLLSHNLQYNRFPKVYAIDHPKINFQVQIINIRLKIQVATHFGEGGGEGGGA